MSMHPDGGSFDLPYGPQGEVPREDTAARPGPEPTDDARWRPAPGLAAALRPLTAEYGALGVMRALDELYPDAARVRANEAAFRYESMHAGDMLRKHPPSATDEIDRAVLDIAHGRPGGIVGVAPRVPLSAAEAAMIAVVACAILALLALLIWRTT